MEIIKYLPSLIGNPRIQERESSNRSPRRLPIPPEYRAFICPFCDVVLNDGAIYDWCPRCSAFVDWVDLRKPVWSCPSCDRMSNLNLNITPFCPSCEISFERVFTPHAMMMNGDEALSGPSTFTLERMTHVIFSQTGLAAIFLVTLFPVVLLAALESYRWMVIGVLGPLVLMPLVVSAFWLGDLAGSVGAILQMSRDVRVRVVHGIEHGTIALLRRQGIDVIGGSTLGEDFEVYLPGDRLVEAVELEIERACREAIHRIRMGEEELGFDRHCGTSWAVGATCLSVVGLIAGLAGLLLTLPVALLVVSYLTVAVATIAFMKPLGLAMQRVLTVSTDFTNATIVGVARTSRTDGRSRYLVSLDVICDEPADVRLPYR